MWKTRKLQHKPITFDDNLVNELVDLSDQYLHPSATDDNNATDEFSTSTSSSDNEFEDANQDTDSALTIQPPMSISNKILHKMSYLVLLLVIFAYHFG